MNKCLILIGCWIFFILSGCAHLPSDNSSHAQVVGKRENAIRTADLAHYENAKRLLESGDYDKALSELQRITAANPGFIEAWVNQAIALNALQKYSDADKAIQQAARLGATSAEFYNILGLIDLANHRYQLAEQHLQKSINQNTSCAQCHFNLGLLYDVYYQNFARALEHYQIYLAHIQTTDEETEQWMEELRRKLARGK